MARLLRQRGVAVFYDRFERAFLWGIELPVALARIYGGKARYCVMFVSESYVTKQWPVFERQHAIKHQIEQRGGEFILPIRVDDTTLRDLPATIAYEDLRTSSIAELVDLLCEKLKTAEHGRTGHQEVERIARVNNMDGLSAREVQLAVLHSDSGAKPRQLGELPAPGPRCTTVSVCHSRAEFSSP